MPQDSAQPVTVVPLQEVFAAPIRAVIQADFMAAEQFVEYIRHFGFEPGTQAQANGGSFGSLRMVSFDYQRPGPSGRPETASVRIPALSLVPLPLLHVEQAEFRFGVRLLQALEPPKRRERLGLLGDPPESAGKPAEPVRWQAVVADEPRDGQPTNPVAPQLQANVRAMVQVRRADIPAGIATLLALMSESTQLTVQPAAQDDIEETEQ